MRRFHSEREHALMFKRWKQEMEGHGYDWRCPPTDPDACHCAKGIGSMRTHRPYECSRGRRHCWLCHYEKYAAKARNTKYEAIKFELRASG